MPNNGKCSRQLNDIMALNDDLLDVKIACGNVSKFNITMLCKSLWPTFKTDF